ncbi:hypothetical protein MMC13_001537 [Lambiella insularis]|nr:hypothetical protein [Lambiella insularis]
MVNPISVAICLLPCIHHAQALPINQDLVLEAWSAHPGSKLVLAEDANSMITTRKSQTRGLLDGLLDLFESKRKRQADGHTGEFDAVEAEAFQTVVPDEKSLPTSTTGGSASSDNHRFFPRTASGSSDSCSPLDSLILCHILKLNPTTWEDYVDVVNPRTWTGGRIIDGVHIEHVAADAWTGWLQFTNEGRPIMKEGYEEEAQLVTVLCLGKERPLTPVIVDIVRLLTRRGMRLE